MQNGFWVDPIGLSGGLGIFWNDSVAFEVFKFGYFLVDMKVKCLSSSFSWHLINVYLSPDDGVRFQQFHSLSNHIRSLNSKVVIWGDFNDVLDSNEKCGGIQRDRGSLVRFQSFLENCGQANLGFTGYPFTWRNNRQGDEFIESRLDRALVSSQWYLQYNQASVEHLDCVGSDHKALLLKTMVGGKRLATPFRFDARWFEYEEVQADCEASMGPKYFRRKIDQVTTEVKVLESDGREHHLESISALEDQLAREWEQEELYWKQKSHKKWLKLGDRNKSYFHASTVERRRRNHVSGIENEQGVWVSDQQSIATEVQKFFTNLYVSEGVHDVQQVISSIPTRITADMNNKLLKPFSTGEIKTALFAMHPNKAPGYNDQDCGALYRILDLYEAASGQKVNKEKSSVFFSPNTPIQRRNFLAAKVGITMEANGAR
ncbi:hypothetical protein RHSIM_Rhsim05G0086500 [Rhododendron simsii]|uniref:Endonuclease/exonuclease/phosphatase domain-containing protein n=1 Tax=Rhododendron simsii TaxID=118357 RepID=A0A834GY13_RHOSS|nr:hypothetical protein RHSIM_Rhsim05G0086500 [Rhododendron simsii]